METLTLDVLVLVLAAAALHAGWNAVIKGGRDPYASALFVATGAGLVSLPVALALPMPAIGSWPYIAASSAIHIGYFVLLGLSYRTADLGVAYPLMRGGAPLATALLGQFGLGDPVAPEALAGIVVLSVGVLALGGDAMLRKGLDRSTALVVSAMIAIIVAYTICDGIGARLSGEPTSYLAWMFLGMMPFVILLLRMRLPGIGFRPLTAMGWRPAAGGVVSFIAYAIALWAMTKAPISMVAALRETSVLFAVLIGAAIFRERIGAMRIGSALLIVAGIAMMRLV